MKTLAVSIPTYKRPELLHRCLEALAEQCRDHQVDIHVFDDSCCDINLPVLSDWCARFPGILVHYNPVNLGIDRNIDQCVSAPDADFVWIIGEDDLARSGAIGAILHVLDLRRPEYLFVNYQYISNDYKNLLHVAAVAVREGSWRAGEFLAAYGWATGFLGGNVVNKTRWDSLDRQFMGTYFNHVGKIFSGLAPLDTIEVISAPQVYNRAESLDSFTWLKDCFEVTAGFGQMIEKLILVRPEWNTDARLCLAKFQGNLDLRNLKSILMLRALGVYDLAKYRTYLSDQKLWPIYALLARIPVGVVKPFYTGYRVLKAWTGKQRTPPA